MLHSLLHLPPRQAKAAQVGLLCLCPLNETTGVGEKGVWGQLLLHTQWTGRFVWGLVSPLPNCCKAFSEARLLFPANYCSL